MKLTQRQPICITRLRKKQSQSTASTSLATAKTPTCKIQLSPCILNNITNHNENSQISYAKSTELSNHAKLSSAAPHQQQSNRMSYRNSLMHIDCKENNFITSEQEIQLLKQKINWLESSNESLHRYNEQLSKGLIDERKQKEGLQKRIGKLQDSILGLSKDFEIEKSKEKKFISEIQRQNKIEEQNGNEKTNVIEIDYEIEGKNEEKKNIDVIKMDTVRQIDTVRQNEYDRSRTPPMSIRVSQPQIRPTSRSVFYGQNLQSRRDSIYSQLGRSRRNSLQQSFDGSCKEQTTAFGMIKQLKNELQVQKIKRSNLERQIKIYKDNVQIQFRAHIDNLESTIGKLKQQLVKKSNQIREKDGIIQRHIMKR